MGFCPDSVTKPDVPCKKGRGKKREEDYSTRWHVHLLLLCCINLITSMAQDKAVHCGKSFFFFFFQQKSLCWINAPRRNSRRKRHTQRWRSVSKYVTALGFFLTVQQAKVRTTYLQLWGCFYSAHIIHLMSHMPF